MSHKSVYVIVLSSVLLGCSSEALLKPPITAACSLAASKVGLKGCPQMTDAIVSYVDGDKAAAKQALLSVILLNEKGALKVFVSALKQVPGIPQDLLTILSGEPVKEQPVKEIAQQALLGGSATKICSLTLLNSGSQEEDQHWVVDGLGKMETTTVSIFSTDKGCSIYFIGTPSTITRVFPQYPKRAEEKFQTPNVLWDSRK